jgi:hypothetical protein
MKKTALVMIVIGLLSTAAYPFRLGLEFSVFDQPTIGANMRISDMFELKPQMGFSFSENFNTFALLVDGNFYLPQIQDLQHYAGPGIALEATSDDVQFGMNGHYGLRYDFNDNISAFGEIGIHIGFDDFYLTTLRSGAGITIFFPEF